MSKMELQEMVKEKGINASSSTPSKADLVTLLKEAALSEYHASSALPHENEDAGDDLEDERLPLPSFTAGEYVDPLCHIGDSTFNFTSTESDVKERSIHSRIGWRERCNERNEAKKEKRNSKIMSKNKKEVEELRGRGLFPCDETDPETLMRCNALFLSEHALQQHKSSCESGGKHMFPSINSLSKITYDASRGLLDPLNLMVGKRVNRDSGVYDASSESPLETLQTSLPMCQECSDNLDCTKCNGISSLCTGEGCLRRDFSLLKKRGFRASPELIKDLEALFLKGEYRDNDDNDTSKQKIKAAKYTHIEAVAVLHNMKVDGRRKYREGGQFGPLPTTNYVRSWFSNRKRKGAKGLLSKDDNDIFHGMTISLLKEKFIDFFGCKPTAKKVLQKLLEVDDLLQDGGHDNAYSSLSVTNLEKECKDRNLPHSVNIKSLKIILRAHMKSTQAGEGQVQKSSQIMKMNNNS